MHKCIHEEKNCQLIVAQKRYREVQENWDTRLHPYCNGTAERSGTRIHIKKIKKRNTVIIQPFKIYNAFIIIDSNYANMHFD